MTSQTIPPTRLIEALRCLLERFHDELSGPRQATRVQLVQFLARHLEIDREVADKLFDELRDAEVILRGDERSVDLHLPDRSGQQWSVSTLFGNQTGEE